MRMYDIIAKKRDMHELLDEEISYFVEGVTNGSIPDYQISALLMAIYLNKLTDRESVLLANAMMKSGEIVDLSDIEGIKVDKHSTGGVGDKTTLVLAPVIAACGVPVAKMSGRGLGHTGGTIDKLESISGFSTTLTDKEFVSNVNKHGISIIGQSKNIAPADKKLYAIRDVTATVDNPSLIAASVMSKKLASGADKIVLDVKCGNGAFMKDLTSAIKLSELMISIGTGMNKEVVAVVSDMGQPLGYGIGNAIEIKETVKTLKGEGPDDLTELCKVLGSQMLILGGVTNDYNRGMEMFQEAINDGSAYEKFCEFVKAQGGDISQIENLDNLPVSKIEHKIISDEEGYVSQIDSEEIGKCSVMLGAGRENLESVIDMGAGIVLHKKCGDKILRGDIIATIYSDSVDSATVADFRIRNAYSLSPTTVPKRKLVLAILTKDDCIIY